jgi:hypothetical protein
MLGLDVYFRFGTNVVCLVREHSETGLNAEYEAYKKSLDDEVSSDSDFNEDDPDFERGVRGQYAGFVRVGQGVTTNSVKGDKRECGSFHGYDICPKVHLHDFVSLDGHSHKGKVYWVKRFRYCFKPSCPICAKSGWAVREARSIEFRIKQFERGGLDREGKRFNGLGRAEHIIWSPASSDYGLSFEKLRAKMFADLKACHVAGGVEIFHMERFANWYEAKIKNIPVGWRISLHFHVIGFIDGGYSRCRNCKKSRTECLKCDGFDGCARRVHFGYVDDKGKKHEGDGAIIKVKGVRKTVFGTAWYQLNHATMRVGVERQRVARWFGTCSYRKLQLRNAERYVRKCPICASDLVRGRFVGAGSGDGGAWWLSEGESDFLDGRGVPNWIVLDSG